MPLRRLFDYLPPALPGPQIVCGMRVRVPFGSQRLVGIVMEVADSTSIPPDRIKQVLEVLDTTPVLDESAVALLRWAADYYHHPIGEVLAAALPKALRLGAGSSSVQERWIVTTEGAAAFEAGEPKRAPKQRNLLKVLMERDGALADELDELAAGWREAARALAKRGWIASVEHIPQPPDDVGRTRESGPPLSPEQH